MIRARTCLDHELGLLGVRPIVKMERGEGFTGSKFFRRIDVNLQRCSLPDSERIDSDEAFALMGCCAAYVGRYLPTFWDIFKGQAVQQVHPHSGVKPEISTSN